MFLNKKQMLSDDELVRLTELFVEVGVTKLRLTGGEPLLRPNIISLIRRLAALPNIEDLAMTTNASLLPKYADALHEAGLHRLTISLDSLDEPIFQQMNGYKSTVAAVLNGIRAAEDAGFSPLKINCVVKKNVNDHTIADLARHFRDTPHIVRFIEYMDVGNLNGWVMDDVVSADQMLQILSAEIPLEPLAPNYDGEVARRFRYRDGSGEIGFITSVTKPFCGNCTRARLSAAGEYYTCLFGLRGTDLRAPLRDGASDADLLNLISATWSRRTDRYSELRTSFTKIPRKGAEMYRLGG